MKVTYIMYANTYKEYCQILRDLVSTRNLIRHHSAQTPATHNLKKFDAIACFIPYDGKFGKGFKMIRRFPRIRRNCQIVYYVERN